MMMMMMMMMIMVMNWYQMMQLSRVRERTIPTEPPPLVGEVIANLYG
jgi:hypothetical protein